MTLTLSATPAQAAITHEFIPSTTEALRQGVPTDATPEEAVLTGPLSGVSSLTTDSGHVWVAERIEAGANLGRSRVDEFDATSGKFLPRQLREEGQVSQLDHGVAVGHPAGEEEIYVGAAHEGQNVVAAFGTTGKLQSEGVWSGKNTPGKSFGSLLGVAVDSSANLETHGDVYVANGNVVDVFAGEAGGKEPALVGELSKAASEPFHELHGVAVSAFNADVLVSDGNGEACSEGEAECGVDVFEPAPGFPGTYTFLFKIVGAPGQPFKRLGPLAVDAGNGDMYVVETQANVVDQFDASGKFLGQLKGTPAGAFKSLKSVAVDASSGDVFIGDFDEEHETGAVDAFGPSRIVPDVTTAPATAIKVDAQGGIEATLNGTVNPRSEGEATCRFAYGPSSAFGTLSPCQPEGVPNGASPVAKQATVKALAPDTTYSFRLQASSENGTNQGEVADDKQFHTPGPGIHSQSVADVAGTSATLNAAIDPNGAATSYFFQYGKSAEYETSVPAPPGEALGAGSGDIQVAPRHIQGLSPSTAYHYRVVAVSTLSVEGTPTAVSFAGADQTFTTQGASAGGTLADGRRWELVSPPNKHGALLQPIAETGVIQASLAGTAATYFGSLPIEETVKGYIYNWAQVVSARGANGWTSQNVSLPHATATSLPIGRGGEYRAFSPDLSLGMIQPYSEFTSLSPEAFPPDTESTPYLRHDATCSSTPATCYQPLATAAPGFADVPEGMKFGGGPFESAVTFVGGSPDLTHVIVSSGVQLTTTPTNGKVQLYEWSAGRPATKALQLVSVLSGGEAAGGEAQLGFQGTIARNAVSSDGSRVVWSEHSGHLYLRDTAKEQTLQLDAPQAQCLAEKTCGGGVVSPKFQIASADGSRVLFSDAQKLSADAAAVTGKADLYECEMVEEAGVLRCELTDLTPAPGPGAAADVQATVLGASDDGSWVYFVANGLLGDAGERGASVGDCKVNTGPVGEGQCNLYVRHDGVTKLIAVVSGADYPDWSGAGGVLNELTARVAPNGEYLAFMSQLPLTGYDNKDAVSNQPDEEVFLYHAEAGGQGKLVCASCDPSGARPKGVEYAKLNNQLVGGDRVWSKETWLAANVPGWTPYRLDHALYQSRYLSDSGRLFFNSSDALLAKDINNNQDVYEFEPSGVGSCSGARAGFSSATDGCVSLVSSGRASGESAFMDASESGDDVFFLTAERLVAKDVDSAVDLYDAHVCSGGEPCFDEPAPPPPCATADACRVAPAPQPGIFGAPSSATFSGQGNLAPAASVPSLRPRGLSRVQRLAKALGVCRRKYSKAKRGRARCERVARKRYGAVRARKVNVNRAGNR